MTTNPLIFYNTINNKGDKVNLVIPLIKSNSTIINRPFQVKMEGKLTTHSPLTFCLTLKYQQISKVLLENGADPIFKTLPDEDQPLHIASKNGLEEIVKMLLENSLVNINALNKRNETCFSLALNNSHNDIYNLIIKKIQIKGAIHGTKPKYQILSNDVPSKKSNKIKEDSKEPNDDSASKESFKDTIQILEEKIKKLTHENFHLKKQLEEMQQTIAKIKKEGKSKDQKENSKKLLSVIQNEKFEIAQACQNSKNTSTISTDEHTEKILFSFQESESKVNIGEIKTALQVNLIEYQNYTKSIINKNKAKLAEIISILQDTVDKVSSNYEVQLYGSRATNLCLSWSDIDVVITQKNKKNKIIPNFLEKLNEILNQQPWVKYIKFIQHTKIPIIKITASEKFDFIQIDISIEDGNHFGMKCVNLVKEYLNEYEILEPLVFAMKTLLKLSCLNDPYTGGISSYGIILMIVYFLKREKAQNRSIELNDMGSVMLNMLYYYGGKSSNYVNVSNINEVDHTAALYPFDLFIIDPLNLSNNVGKSTFHYFNLKSMFLIALSGIEDECFCECHEKENKCYSHNILKKMFNAVKRGVVNTNYQYQ